MDASEPTSRTIRIDELGRICIPRDLRLAAGMLDGTLVTLELTERGVLLRLAPSQEEPEDIAPLPR